MSQTITRPSKMTLLDFWSYDQIRPKSWTTWASQTNIEPMEDSLSLFGRTIDLLNVHVIYQIWWTLLCTQNPAIKHCYMLCWKNQPYGYLTAVVFPSSKPPMYSGSMTINQPISFTISRCRAYGRIPHDPIATRKAPSILSQYELEL